MTLTDLAGDWVSAAARIRTRFPNIDASAMALLGADPVRFEAHLAAAHNLTLTEVREELADYLYVETLKRELGDG